jgi:hypothetical protein
MAHLNGDAAKWQLYEFDERHDEVTAIDFGDRGNIATRLVHCPDETTVLERFAESIHRVLSQLPESEVAVLSTAEVVFRWSLRGRVSRKRPDHSAWQKRLFSESARKSGRSQNGRARTSRN